MKQILLTLTTVTILLTACNSEKKNPMDTEKRIVFTDTSLLRASNGSTDKAATGNNVETTAPETSEDKTKPKVVTVTKYVRVIEKQRAPRRRSTNRQQQQSNNQNNEPVTQAPAPSTAGNGGNNSGDGGVASAPAEPEVKKKKGWSDAAKGATIGGVGGAVAGAVISKNKGKGAIIGGVIGAAGGYILGRKKDKKSGRVNYTQK
jgi:YMGG-like Gly-zipper